MAEHTAVKDDLYAVSSVFACVLNLIFHRVNKYTMAFLFASRTRNLFFTVLYCIAVLGSCLEAEDSQYTAEEANLEVFLAYTLQNARCESERAMDTFLFASTRKEDIELCMLAILSTPCPAWQSNEAVLACMAVSVQF